MERIRKIRQQDRYDCGAACLSSVASWYGVNVPLARVRQLCGCSQAGTSIGGILAGARELGLDAKAYKSADGSLLPLKKLVYPVIVHMKREDGSFHFAVLYKTGRKRLTLMDPDGGEIIKITPDKFKDQWTGYIILAVPGERFAKREEKVSLREKLAYLLLFHKKEILLSLAGSAVLVLTGAANSLFLQQIIDKAVPSRNPGLLAFISAVIFLLLLFSLYIGYQRLMFLIRCGIKIDMRLVTSYLKKLFRLPAGSLLSYTPGDLHARLSDAFKIRIFISDGLISVFISFFTFAAALVLMFAYNSRLAALTLLFLPFYLGLYILSGHINKKYNRRLAGIGARFESGILEAIRGMRVIKYYGAMELPYGKIEKTYSELASQMYRSGRAHALFGTAGEGLTRTLSSAVLVAGALTVLNLQMSIGELVSFYTLASFLTAPLNNLAGLNNMIAQAVVSSERLFEILDMEEEDSGNKNAGPEGTVWKTLLEKTRDIRLENISFTYPGQKSLFDNFSLGIPEGSLTVLSGKSGCGKSTLVSLLMRDIRPRNGKIFLENADISAIGLRDWRNYICLVPQQSYLFNGTVLENITSGDPETDICAVLELCIRMGMGNLIKKLPDGLLTPVGDAGQPLSGGEMQKISIVRAVYKDPNILILDEATSSLDRESERTVLREIARLKDKGKTIIMITHKIPCGMTPDLVLDIEDLKNKYTSAHSGEILHT